MLYHSTVLTREVDCRQKIPSIFSFVSGSLRPVKSETDPLLSSWYKANSLIYVSPDHACWNDEESARKVKKHRFGGVRCAEVKGLGGMMERHEAEAQKWVLDKVREWVGEEEEEEEEQAAATDGAASGEEANGDRGDETEDEMVHEPRLGVTRNGRAIIV